MAKVYLKPGETIDSALERFREKCKREGLWRDIRRTQSYTKPSALRRKGK